MSIRGTFEIEITPGDALLPGTGRFDFTKVWEGDILGASKGVMISAGDPASGTAGYVCMEAFEGEIGGKLGTLAFQQFGTMDADGLVLHYEIVPGSGTEQLAGIRGTVDLDVVEGVHKVVLRHNL